MSWQDIMKDDDPTKWMDKYIREGAEKGTEKDEQTDEMAEANQHLSESLEVAIRVYSQLKELVDEDNHTMKPKEVDTLAQQISKTMQRVAQKKMPRYLFK